ncbi:SLC13 family permease [Thauera sp.]|jgi:di/tricarboxylate transporter|uniref:SLC13 family permease n=1 Tax=Thauera sp. TaxID=1905334 RepID=UPI002A35D1AC|nr:SLC13 family permease [Thauera sp.]MDX9884294.1 SLC13 family permease [Thauera sp.]
MMHDQTLILTILLATIVMFLWGRWRHDMVAVMALLACVLAGLVEPGAAFAGFGHPAVVTVACVLVLSRGLQSSGAVDVLTRAVLPARAGPTASIAALAALAALLSGFMNNVGALALLMPVAVQLAGRLELPPGKVLMPLAFASILGGTTTLIGTPPNLIVSGFRENQADLSGYAMFDFTLVGLPLTVAGVAFIALVGWRLVPAREQPGTAGFDTGAYITEARVPEGSKAAGMRLREIENELDEADAQIVGLVRNDVKMSAPSGGRVVRAGDILVLEAEVEALPKVLAQLGLELEEGHKASKEKKDEDKPEGAAGDERDNERSDDLILMELVVRPESALSGRSASDILLRSRYGLNLLAVSRDGARSKARLRRLKIRPGDLLLMQGPSDILTEFAADFGCVPLAERQLRIPDRGKAITATLIMLIAVGVAATGLLPAAVSFAGGVLASMALRTVSPRTVYDAVDWPVVVLLAALLPVAGAMQSTGAADLVARLLLDSLARGDAVIGLAVILITTMVLTDLMNNAATAAVMAPIGMGAAMQLGVNPDTFLMAVAIGASCAFLTPIGHQNNTLILGPGGFRFGDYWRMGVPVDLLVIAVALPLLLLFWPLAS